MKQESKVVSTGCSLADCHLFFHYKNLLDLGVLGQAYSPRKGAADELGGSSARGSLPWPKAEGEKGRRPSWPSHHHICIAAFETEARPGRGGGGPWPLAFLHRSDLYAGWDPNSPLNYTQTLRADAGRDSCALCATTQELYPPHGLDSPSPTGCCKGLPGCKLPGCSLWPSINHLPFASAVAA